MVTQATKSEKSERAPLREYVASTYCSLNITVTLPHTQISTRSCGAQVRWSITRQCLTTRRYLHAVPFFTSSKPSDLHHVLIPIMR
jgi:hypothetical protein